ncbi:hypothetical protein M432DRAFT_642203 [Thermoascus aurantiacus ATCC 26904]
MRSGWCHRPGRVGLLAAGAFCDIIESSAQPAVGCPRGPSDGHDTQQAEHVFQPAPADRPLALPRTAPAPADVLRDSPLGRPASPGFANVAPRPSGLRGAGGKESLCHPTDRGPFCCTPCSPLRMPCLSIDFERFAAGQSVVGWSPEPGLLTS